MHYTGSARAKHVLDNWSALLPKFVKVVPTDYRRALTENQFETDSPPASTEPEKREAARG